MMNYSVVIATLDRPESLKQTLESLSRQTILPEAVLIVDASDDDLTRQVSASFSSRLPIHHFSSRDRSAARQRNFGADQVSTSLIAFMDDDVVLPSNLFELLIDPFSNDDAGEIGGIAGRIRGMEHPKPQGFLWWYFRLQAGYSDPHYGARLFGPAINTLPCYPEQPGPMIPSEWLNSTCVVYRTDLFKKFFFPAFEGYSHMEDVYLSASIKKTHHLYFHSQAWYDHLSVPSPAKADRRKLAQMRFRNQARVAREIQGLPGPRIHLQLFFHRIFTSFYLIRFQPEGWKNEFRGTWDFTS